MVYALAYGKPAAEALDRIMAEGRLGKVLTQAPARLKPVDQDAIRIVPEAVKNAPNVRASLGSDERTLVLDVEAAGLVPTVTLQASLENRFYPYVIQKASVEASLAGASERTSVRVSPAAVEGLQPGARQPVEVSFTLPMAQVPSPWSAQAMTAMGKQILIPLTVELGLTGQQLAISESFASKMRELFPGDPISDVFIPPESVRASQVRVPLLLRIQYPLTSVLALMGGVLALLGVLTGLLIALRSSRRYELMVDGMRRNVVLKPFASLAIKDGEGQTVGQIKRGVGKPQIVSVAEGRTLSVTGR
jgi:hypothetical protein